MVIKTSDDYLDDLEVYFPSIGREELDRIVNFTTYNMCNYVKTPVKGFVCKTLDSEYIKGGMFRIGSVYGKRNLYKYRAIYKTRKLNKNGK